MHARVAASDTRERILAVAGRLFAEHGYRGVAMREIAVACQITKPALYYHFRNKDDLFTRVLLHELAELRHGLEAALAGGGSFRDRLVALCRYLVRASRHDLDRLMRDVVTELPPDRQEELRHAHYAEFVAPLKGALVQARARGEIREVDASLATWALLGLMTPLVRHETGGLWRNREQLVEDLVDLYLQGVEAPARGPGAGPVT